MAVSTLAALAAIVFVAFSVEAAIGFGATVVTVALAANLVTIDALLPAYVPLNMVLSSFLVLRGRRLVDTRALFAKVLPPMVLGLPIGLYLLGSLDPVKLRVAFGVFVVGLSVVELARSRASAAGPTSGQPRASVAFDAALLFLGGIIHGAFGTGGPMAVYVAGKRLGGDRGVFRATLSALWLLLNIALVATFFARGKVDAASLRTTALLAPSLGAGLALGAWLHDRIPERLFRTGIFVLLAIAGAVLVARALTA